MKKIAIIFVFFASVVPSIMYAHPGRTNSSGCHTCRTNCASWGLSTGEDHCHNAKTIPQPIEPIKSTYGANGTGYTTPAPEYKQPKNTVTKTVPVVNSIKTTPTITSDKKVVTTTPIVTAVKIEEKKVSWFAKFINWFK